MCRHNEKQNQVISLSLLSRRQYKYLLVIHEIYRQQQWMYEHKSRRIDDRIVSINKPNVRPIKRGKAFCDESGKMVESHLFALFPFVPGSLYFGGNAYDMKEKIKALAQKHGYSAKGLIIVSLLFPPAGLFVAVKHPTWTKLQKGIAIVAVLAWNLFPIFGVTAIVNAVGKFDVLFFNGG